MQRLRHVSVSCDNDLIFSERYFWNLQKHFLESLRILGKGSVFPILCCIPKLCKAKTYHDKRFDTKNKVRKSFSMSYRYIKLAGIGLYHCLNEGFARMLVNDLVSTQEQIRSITKYQM